jgi:hypothetical protein
LQWKQKFEIKKKKHKQETHLQVGLQEKKSRAQPEATKSEK